MPISDLKEILIRRINAIEDENFLNVIKELTEHPPGDPPYELNDFEKVITKSITSLMSKPDTLDSLVPAYSFDCILYRNPFL